VSQKHYVEGCHETSKARGCPEPHSSADYAARAFRRREDKTKPAKPIAPTPVMAMTIDGGAGTTPPPPAGISVPEVPKEICTLLTVVPVVSPLTLKVMLVMPSKYGLKFCTPLLTLG
jgi:hypothetical protein